LNAVAISPESTASSPEEIAWSFRKLLESRAADRPLVVVFDDIHWGEPAFLDLVEHIADLSRGAPILLLCMARPELLDRRSTWGGGKLNATNVLLEPLGPEAAGELIGALTDRIPDTLRDRILEAAGGSGFGAPRERPLELVQRDLTEGYITPRGLAAYGARMRNGKVVRSPMKRLAKTKRVVIARPAGPKQSPVTEIATRLRRSR